MESKCHHQIELEDLLSTHVKEINTFTRTNVQSIVMFAGDNNNNNSKILMDEILISKDNEEIIKEEVFKGNLDGYFQVFSINNDVKYTSQADFNDIAGVILMSKGSIYLENTNEIYSKDVDDIYYVKCVLEFKKMDIELVLYLRDWKILFVAAYILHSSLSLEKPPMKNPKPAKRRRI